jgi:hypothetical protein
VCSSELPKAVPLYLSVYLSGLNRMVSGQKLVTEVPSQSIRRKNKTSPGRDTETFELEPLGDAIIEKTPIVIQSITHVVSRNLWRILKWGDYKYNFESHLFKETNDSIQMCKKTLV